MEVNFKFFTAAFIAFSFLGCGPHDGEDPSDVSPPMEEMFKELDAIAQEEGLDSTSHLADFRILFEQLVFEKRQDFVLYQLDRDTHEKRFQFRFPVGGDYYYPTFDAALKREGYKEVGDMIYAGDYDFNKLKKVWAKHRKGFSLTDSILIHEVEFKYGEDVPAVNKRVFFNGFEIPGKDFIGSDKEKYVGDAKFIPTFISIISYHEHVQSSEKISFEVKINGKTKKYKRDVIFFSVEKDTILSNFYDFNLPANERGITPISSENETS